MFMWQDTLFWGSLEEGKVKGLHFFTSPKCSVNGNGRGCRGDEGLADPTAIHGVIPTSSRSLKPSARNPEASKKISQSRQAGREHSSMGNF